MSLVDIAHGGQFSNSQNKWEIIRIFAVIVVVQSLSHVWLFVTLWTTNIPTRFLWPWDSPDKNTEWVAMPFSMASSRPRDWTCTSYIGRQILYHWVTREAQSEYGLLLWTHKSCKNKWNSQLYVFQIEVFLTYLGFHFKKMKGSHTLHKFHCNKFREQPALLE